MFYCNLEHTSKKAVKTRSGKVKNAATAKNRFHYITRTSHFKNYKESASEQIEFVRSGNLPNFAEGKPAEFWDAADIYERSNGRTCSSLVVALPKELNQAQRIELAEAFIAEFADRYSYPFTCAIHNHVGSLGGQEQPHLHFMYSERHVDGIDRTAEQFFKRYNPKDPQKGGAQKLTADVLGMGKAQLQLYRQKTEELINDSLMRYAPTKMVEIKGIQVEVPSLVSCLSNKEYNKKHGTQLKDVPVMNKAVRFAREKEPELVAERERMTAEINRLRAENHYELYRPFYEAELKNRQEIEELSTQAETPRTRQRWYAQEKLLFLQQKMQQTLLQDHQTTEPFRLIQHDLQAYIDLLNTEFFDRLEKFEYLSDLGQRLKNSVIQIASIDEELAFMQRQVIERVPLQMRDKAVTPDKIRNHDQDNDFSSGF
ncbi:MULTISPECIES: MobA/MobL family protein [unclassified Acinetobacter]|uniref:MobA/MobL family protein n=1 Tax=unclassified Acinetobacter TaxID=196816 RepID=UPI0015D0DA35|nr:MULTISPECIES: MobA/MobL family protein [unclassified Acinetobacter]